MSNSLVDRARYRFDGVMASGPAALLALLFLASALFVVGVTLVVVLFRIAPAGEPPLGTVEALWQNMLRTLDPGTMSGDQGWAYRSISLVATLGGLSLVATLIGAITSIIGDRFENLRKGRSRVVEQGHTLILGWTSEAPTVISQLIASENRRTPLVIVILTTHDRTAVEQVIAAQVVAIGRTRIVCRTGSPLNSVDLGIVNPQGTRSIIVLPSETDDSDSYVIKTLLAITHSPLRRKEPYEIVTVLRDSGSRAVVKLIAGDEVRAVIAGDTIARIAAQTCRQSGLSAVYSELLEFGGNEIYFRNEPRLVGLTFAEALYCFEQSSVIGLRKADGRLQLLPPMKTPVSAGDHLIVIAADDESVRLVPPPKDAIDEGVIQPYRAVPQVPERTLLLGWNLRVPMVITQLDVYFVGGSKVTVVADAPGVQDTLARECHRFRHIEVKSESGDTTDRQTLERQVTDDCDHVIVFGDGSRSVEEADARTVVTLLHLRDIAQKRGLRFSLVGEILDAHTRELASVTRADDFVVSDRLVSLLLSQIATGRDRAAVFEDLFDVDGAEIYLRRAEEYVQPESPMSFYTVVEAAKRRGEVAIGYRQLGYENVVRLNPSKTDRVTFSTGDRIVVIAQS